MPQERSFSSICLPRQSFFPSIWSPPTTEESNTLSSGPSSAEPSIPSPTIIEAEDDPTVIAIAAQPQNHLDDTQHFSATYHTHRDILHDPYHHVNVLDLQIRCPSGFRETPCQDQHSLSLTNYNHCLGDAIVLPNLTKEIHAYTTISTAIVLAERADTDDDVGAITRSAKMWLEHDRIRAQLSKEQARMEAMRLARNLWANACEDRFLSHEEYEVFIGKRLLTSDFMDEQQKRRLLGTTQALVLVNILSGLFLNRILTNEDIVLVCEILIVQNTKNGFMKALYGLLGRTTTKAFSKGARKRLRDALPELEKWRHVPRDEMPFELECYLDDVIEIIEHATCEAQTKMFED